MANAQAANAKNPYYDYLRQRIGQQSQSAAQQQQDALQRRFASLGALNSGASIKQQQLAQQQADESKADQLAGIDAQEAQENFQRQEVERQRQFQTQERQGSQDFAGQQAAIQRQYGTQERLGGQDFGAAQAALQRQFGTQERLGGQEFAGQQAAMQRAYGTQERLGQQGFQREEAQTQRGFASQERMDTQVFQKDLQRIQLDQNADQFTRSLAEQMNSRLDDIAKFNAQMQFTRERALKGDEQADRDYKFQVQQFNHQIWTDIANLGQSLAQVEDQENIGNAMNMAKMFAQQASGYGVSAAAPLAASTPSGGRNGTLQLFPSNRNQQLANLQANINPDYGAR